MASSQLLILLAAVLAVLVTLMQETSAASVHSTTKKVNHKKSVHHKKSVQHKTKTHYHKTTTAAHTTTARATTTTTVKLAPTTTTTVKLEPTTTTVSRAAATTISSGAAVVGGASASDIKTILDTHNKYRAKHHAPALVWDETLAAYAQKWSDRCVFEHSHGKYGENLAEGHPSWTAVVDAWYNEVDMYDYSKPGFSMDTGHFTQVVWKGTTKIGCGAATCDDFFKGAKLYTCSYVEFGNIVGLNDDPQYFIANVLKP